MGAAGTRHSPRPLLSGRTVHAHLGRDPRRGNAELCLMKTNVPHSRSSSPGLTGRPNIPETLMIKSRGRAVLDRPVKPDDDRFGCLKIESGSGEAVTLG